MRQTFRLQVLAFVAALVCTTMGRASAVRAGHESYAVTDLGADVSPLRINNAGQIVGTFDHQGDWTAFSYLTGSFQVLGTLWLHSDYRGSRYIGHSEACAVNAQGTIVGSSSTEGIVSFDVHFGPHHAFRLAGGEMKDIGMSPSGKTFEVACDIDAQGRIVGELKEAHPSYISHACLWQDGTLTDLGTMGAESSSAVAINRYGHIACWAESSDAREHAFLWSAGKMHRLPIPRGYEGGHPNSLNDADQIAGTVQHVRNDPQKSGHGMWEQTERAALWHGTKVHILGRLGGDNSSALSVNAHGSVVGESEIDAVDAKGSPVLHAFLYANGRLRDLNRLIGPRSGWILTSAASINDRGQIIGKGLYHGQEHGFLLVPN